MTGRTSAELLDDEQFRRAVDRLIEDRIVDGTSFEREVDKLIARKLREEDDVRRQINGIVAENTVESEQFKSYVKEIVEGKLTEHSGDIAENTIASEPFKKYVQSVVDSEFSEQIGDNVETKYTKGLSKVLSFLGLRTTPRFSLILVPIILAAATFWTLKEFVLDKTLDEMTTSISDLKTSAGTLKTSVDQLVTTTEDQQAAINGNLVGIEKNEIGVSTLFQSLNNAPDGFWIHSIRISNPNSHRFILPIKCDSPVSMKIFLPEGSKVSQFEDAIFFRVNRQVIESAGESEHKRFWSRTSPYLEHLSEIGPTPKVFKRNGEQLFEFAFDSSKIIVDPTGGPRAEDLENVEIQVLLYVTRPFRRTNLNSEDGQPQPEQPEAPATEGCKA